MESMIKPMQIRSWNDLLFLIARQTDRERERSGFPSLVGDRYYTRFELGNIIYRGQRTVKRARSNWKVDASCAGVSFVIVA